LLPRRRETGRRPEFSARFGETGELRFGRKADSGGGRTLGALDSAETSRRVQPLGKSRPVRDLIFKVPSYPVIPADITIAIVLSK
jgi:hypothetical protein